MRLCLDEHYSPRIAERLRELGHDVHAVKERPELAAVSDRDLLAAMREERRAVLTENVADFMRLVRELEAAGDSHYGVIFSSPRSLPRSRETIGLFVERLHEFLTARSAEDALRDRIHWLQP